MMKAEARVVRTVAAVLVLTACGDLASQPDRVPRRLEILPADTSVLEGDAVSYQLRVLDESGAEFRDVPSWAAPEWSVSDPVVASLGPAGQVTGREGGRDVRVLAGFAGLLAGARLRVNPRILKIDAPAVHLTQAVQTLGGAVPLIAGRPALLRVFLTGDRPSFFRPSPLATFYENGAPIHSMRLDPALDRIPLAVDEGDLDRSFNGQVPGWVLQPGVGMVVELDPDGIVPATSGSARRVPAEGWMALDVRVLPTMDLTVVPVHQGADSRPVLTWVEGMTATSRKMRFFRSVLPIGELNLTIREPWRTSANLASPAGWFELLREIDLLRITEAPGSYHYGAFAVPPESPWRGLGYIGRPLSVGNINHETFAHELGHNMGLRHAPCGVALSPDPNFPYEDGSIGVFGYEARGGFTQMADPSEYWDLMTYCDPSWISDYHFVKAMKFRQERETLTVIDRRQETLLLWGNAGGGELLLDPAFVIDATPRLPIEAGPYRLEGFDAGGRSLFSLAFSPDELEFGAGPFVFAIPYDAAWEGPRGLDHVRLSGPEGSVALPRSGGRQVALVTDPATGRLRGMLRDGAGVPAWAVGLDIVVSDGLPGSGISGPRE
ncbi:M66 family metalloprotease [Candidatus Palauibacter sp.]|uniref:M66 family metalloprotease n=1 Tax=Candidatus Palauibacter sp. TaxID=3101350 RepID=UPI003AF27377